MRFYEFEAKALLGKQGVPLARNGTANTPEEAARLAGEIGGPVVLKSQVLSGGRMKAGGIKFADTPDEASAAAAEILKLEINGQLPRNVLVEAKANVAHEYYAGVIFDALAKRPLLIFSDMGGIDIEEVAESHPEHISRTHLSSLLPLSDYKVKEAIAALGVTGADLTGLIPIVTRLVRTFLQYGLTLAEINPLAKLDNGRFMCLDCHIDMEEEARGGQAALLQELGIGREETRQARPPTPFEIKGAEVDAVDARGVAGRVVEFEGNLGLIIGAGGGSLTLFDAVRKYGGKAANYCEIGGNPSVKKACELTKLILSKPGVEKIAVMMNVVSNTRVDIMARGVIKGVIESGFDPAEKIVMFRIPGSWEDEGAKILRKYGIEFCDRTVSMNEAARRAVARMAGA